MSKDKWIHLYYYVSLVLIVIFGCILFFYKFIDGVYYNPILTFPTNIAIPEKTEYKIR